MSTNEQTNRGRRPINVAAIALLVVIGVVLAGIQALRGDWVPAGLALVWFLGIAALAVVFSRRSETVAMLTDDVHEERNVHIHQRAALVTANILAAVIVGAGVVDVASGGDGSPYFWLAAIGGGTYIVSLLVINRRS